jgi:pyruvate kinase
MDWTSVDSSFPPATSIAAAVWATQVLDTLARTGRPSRAEVTDAAMAVRAECVMLNKGPYVAEAMGVLDDILRRMEQHQYKKRSLYRGLHLQLPEPTGEIRAL